MEVSFGKPTEGLISQAEYDRLNFYSDHSTFGEIGRIRAYYQNLQQREKVEVITKLGNYCLLNAFLHGTKGGVIGGLIGAAGGFLYANVPGMTSGSWLGVKVGGTLGLVHGFFKGGYNFKVQFLASPKYREWIKKTREEKLYPIYEKVIKEDKRFEKFICLLSLDLISVPVRAPDEKIYELSWIVNHLNEVSQKIRKAIESGANEQKITELKTTINPFRGAPFTINDLQYHQAYFGTLDILIKQKLSEIEDIEVKRIFEIGTQALKETHEENRKMILHGQIGQITEFVLKNNIPRKIADDACRLLMQEYA